MKNIIIPTKKLIPIASIIHESRIKYYATAGIHKSTIVVPHNNGYLIADGHHKSCVAHVTEGNLSADVLETEEDFWNYHHKGALLLASSMADFINQCETKYLPLRREEGILTIEDLVRKYDLEKLVLGLLKKYGGNEI